MTDEEQQSCDITPERHLEIIILTEDCDGSVPCPKCHAELALDEVTSLRADADRYRTALERIATHEVPDPVDEWAEALAYHELGDIAREALGEKVNRSV